MTQKWLNDDIFVIFRWTVPFSNCAPRNSCPKIMCIFLQHWMWFVTERLCQSQTFVKSLNCISLHSVFLLHSDSADQCHTNKTRLRFKSLTFHSQVNLQWFSNSVADQCASACVCVCKIYEKDKNRDRERQLPLHFCLPCTLPTGHNWNTSKKRFQHFYLCQEYADETLKCFFLLDLRTERPFWIKHDMSLSVSRHLRKQAYSLNTQPLKI